MATKEWILLGLGIVILISAYFLRNLLGRLLLQGVLFPLRKKNPAKAEAIIPVMMRPLGWFLMALAVGLTLPLFPFAETISGFFYKLMNSLYIAIAVWLFYVTVQHFLNYVDAKGVELVHPLNQTAKKYLSGAIRVVIIVVGVILVLEQWFTNLGGLITSLGIGGIALALAAQDTASNLVAGLAIMLDKPFDVGDWVETKSSSGDVSGTVTDIGLRSSRVRALDGSFVTVPNSLLGAAVIVNGTKRQIRMANQEIPFSADTDASRLELFRSRVLAILAADTEVLEGTASFLLTGFDRGAVIWQCRFQTGADFGTHMETRNRINLRILRLAEELEIEFAQGFAPAKK